ncbi:MAG TPA: hypothetical protein DDZ51_26470 [Planctomycetaceae bacterium]|nr:hypothetical protein [Planctomycetaceae bacterium]
MAVVISNLRQDAVEGNFDLVADINFAGKKKTVVFSRFGNAPQLFSARPTFEPFAVMMLAPAMLAGERLVIEGEVDAHLLFQMNGIVQDILKAVIPKSSKVLVDAAPHQSLAISPGTNDDETAMDAGVGSADDLPAATGFSGGIDSSYVMSRGFFKRDVPKSMQIGLLMHHNVGAFSSTRHYQQSLTQIGHWADQRGLPLVGARCDMSPWYEGMTFLQTHTLRNVAAALSLGHLFSGYMYASGYGIESVIKGRLTNIDSLNTILLPLLQVRHNYFRLFGSEYTRTEKTIRVVSDDLINDSLNVCCRLRRDDCQFLNCGTCVKCSRVIMVAEVMGKTHRLEGNFDMKAFHDQRNRCMFNFIYSTFRPGGNRSNRVLVRYLLENGFKFPSAMRPLLKMAA